MANNSGNRKLGFLGFFGLLGLFGRAEMMSLFVLFGLFALFFTPMAKSDGGKKSPSGWAIVCAGCAAIIVFTIFVAQYVVAPRIAQANVVVPEWDVSIFAAHINEFADASETITDLKIDPRTNSIIVTADAPKLDAAVQEVSAFARVLNPSNPAGPTPR